MNIELNFPPKLRGARSRLYRRRFLQVNTRWKALAEIYTMPGFRDKFQKRVTCVVFSIEFAKFWKKQQKKKSAIFNGNFEIRERCKGVHCVDLGESFPTSIYLQKSASIQPRTS